MLEDEATTLKAIFVKYLSHKTNSDKSRVNNLVYIRDAAEQAIRSKEMAANATALGKELAEAGGIEGIVREIK